MANNWDANSESRPQRTADIAPKDESTPRSWDPAVSLVQLTTDPWSPYHLNTYHVANEQSHNNFPTTLYTDMAQVHRLNYPWNGATQNWPTHQVNTTNTGPFGAEDFGMMTTQDYFTATTSQGTINNEDYTAVASLPHLGVQVPQDQAYSSGGIILPGPLSFPVTSPMNGEDVPQNIPKNLGNSTFLAVFTCEGRVGIRLSLAAQGLLGELDSVQDQSVFQGVDFGTKVYYRLFWPGYKPFEHAQYAKSKKKGYITRIKIVQHVAKITAKFISDNENFLSEDPKWRVGNNGIKLENLELIGLKRYLKAGVVPIFRYRSA
ncbi:hypothetical protein EIP86_002814 [Pleurotus ostreatoroseus]|nr:hypothetical protein EIP86_002814 [Pleurotus ostreatoroseus]